jgi:O-antigen/teichoic acid export membrane protein
MLSSAAVSYYDSSIRIAFLSVTLAVGISKTSNVKMSGLLEVGEDIKNISNKTLSASSLLIFPFLIVFSLNSEYLLKILYGSEYINAKWYLIMVIVQQIFQGYRMQFESIFNSSDDPNKTTKASLFSVIFNVITAPILVIQFGGLGVLYSTILSEFVRIITYQIYIKNIFGSYLIPKEALMQYISFGIIFSILHISN